MPSQLRHTGRGGGGICKFNMGVSYCIGIIVPPSSVVHVLVNTKVLIIYKCSHVLLLCFGLVYAGQLASLTVLKQNRQ